MIKQTGFLREKIVKHERVAVAEFCRPIRPQRFDARQQPVAAFKLDGVALAGLDVGSRVVVEVDGGARSFTCLARLDAPADVKVYRDGGLLQMVMHQLMA